MINLIEDSLIIAPPSLTVFKDLLYLFVKYPRDLECQPQAWVVLLRPNETPAEHKKRLTYPFGHSVPRTELIKETLAWLDRYLGPVK